MANRLRNKLSSKSAHKENPAVQDSKVFRKEGKSLPLRKLYEKKRLRIVGLGLMVFALFLATSSISFLFTWWKDADLIEQKGFEFLFLHNISVDNLMGRMGLWVAYYLVYRGFGIASLLLYWLLFDSGAFLFFKNYRRFRLSRMSFLIATMLYFSILLNVLFQGSEFYYGGYVGAFLSEWISNFIGIMGLVGFLLIVLFSYIIWRWDLLVNYEVLRMRLSRIWTCAPVQSNEKEIEQTDPTEVHKETAEMPNDKEEETAVGNRAAADISADSLSAASLDTNPLIANTSASSPLLDIRAVEKEIEILDKETPLPQAKEEANQSIQKSTKAVATKEEDINLTVQVKEDIAKEEQEAASIVESNSKYQPPSLSLLKHYDTKEPAYNEQELQEYKDQIIHTLKHFGINIQKISATVGPTVTLYEIVPEDGTRISKIKNLENDIALSLAALGIRIIAPIPGKGTIGIEVPNRNKKIVGLRTLIGSKNFVESDYTLPVALGKKIDNENYIVDLAKMPHLLMAGATGQGKSVGLNALLVSLLYKKSPSELKFVLIDPKKVELSLFRNLERYFLAKLPGESEAIITDTKQVIHTLNALCIEMDNRYDLLKAARCRNIAEYNQKWKDKKIDAEEGHHFLPYIVLVIDEFADLIMTAGKEVELPIARLAQLARAIGIHLVIATQRPSVNIITGMIKANFPARLAFKVSSKVDSRTILDTGGAEQLIGKGDMLLFQGNELIRLQCAFVETWEVEEVCSSISNQPWEEEQYLLPAYEEEQGGTTKEAPSDKDKDPLLEEAARLVVSTQSGSTSLLQRKMRLGFNRAGRLMDQLESSGIVSPPKGSKPRDVLVQTEAELESIFH